MRRLETNAEDVGELQGAELGYEGAEDGLARGRDEERTPGRSIRMLALPLASRRRKDLRAWLIG